MGGRTKIEWTEATWNPVRGCSRVSPGCGGANHQGGCYAEKIAARFSGPGQPFEGFAERTKHGGRWTGKIDVVWDAVELPIRWRKPRRIFANSMSDLFHESLDLEDVATIYGTAIASAHLRKHVFQILTKRSSNMLRVLNDEHFWDVANSTASSLVLEHVDPHARCSDDARATLDEYGPDSPPPGIWLGVSVEDVERKSRIDDLRRTPAALRFLSCEPLLEDLGELDLTGTGWAIVGGESGPNSRPMHPDWARSIRDRCVSAGVPYFFKQWGEWLPGENHMLERPVEAARWQDGEIGQHSTCKGRDDDSGPEWRHSTQPGQPGAFWLKVGKRRTGSMLDGREWRQFPS